MSAATKRKALICISALSSVVGLSSLTVALFCLAFSDVPSGPFFVVSLVGFAMMFLTDVPHQRHTVPPVEDRIFHVVARGDGFYEVRGLLSRNVYDDTTDKMLAEALVERWCRDEEFIAVEREAHAARIAEIRAKEKARQAEKYPQAAQFREIAAEVSKAHRTPGRGCGRVGCCVCGG